MGRYVMTTILSSLRLLASSLFGPARNRGSFRHAAFSTKKPRPLSLEALEDRMVPAGVMGPDYSVVAPPVFSAVMHTAAASQTINQKIVAFAQSHLGEKVGGGECAQLASEALRVAG